MQLSMFDTGFMHSPWPRLYVNVYGPANGQRLLGIPFGLEWTVFTSQRTLDRLRVLFEQTVEQGVACDLFAERLQVLPAFAIV